jgi:hypothetical protein
MARAEAADGSDADCCGFGVRTLGESVAVLGLMPCVMRVLELGHTQLDAFGLENPSRSFQPRSFID